MGAVVIALVAMLFMLLAAIGVVVVRLVATVRQLIAALEITRRKLEPLVTELQENGEIASLEAAQLQASLEALSTRRNGQR
jgi:predicted PurR-regulated permease PerM